MATKKDYYETLGVRRGAPDEDVKRAFRGLARRLHPDVNDAPGAADRFREVAEAYEVLSNADSRALYDRYGHAGLSGRPLQSARADGGNLADMLSMLFGEELFGGGGRGYGPAPGADVGAEVSISLHDAAFGVRSEIAVEVQAPCPRCAGAGAEPGTDPSRCVTCDGAGQVQQVMRTVLGQMVRTGTCPTCGGRGQTFEHPCRECRGLGSRPERRSVSVAIPGGIEHGQRVRVAGQGHAGDPGAAPGDLYVLVHVAEDERFRREGTDLVTACDLTITQAALGATIGVPTLDGESSLEFKPGTQPGEVRVLRGLGMPSLRGGGRRGNLRVLVNVVVPRHLNPDQKKLVTELDGRLQERNYRDERGGFMSRLRRARDGDR